MFFSLDATWYLHVALVIGLIAAVGGFLVGRIPAVDRRQRWGKVLFLAPVAAATVYVTYRALTDPTTPVYEALLLVALSQVFLLFGYGVVWGLSLGGYQIGRRFRSR